MIKINISTKKRMRTILFIVFLVITILIGRLGYIQLIDGKKLSELAYEQQTLDRAINPKRGTIYDSTGQVLAQSSTVETVTVNPGNIDENIKEKVAKKLSEIFGLDYEKILKKVSKRSSIETIAKKVDKEKTDELRKWMEEENITTGINIDESLKFLEDCKKCNIKLWIRQVVVPGMTDSEEYIKELGEFIKTLENII